MNSLWFFFLGGSVLVLISSFAITGGSWVAQWSFMSMDLVDFSVVFILDMYSLLFLFIVVLISSMIYMYTQYYMDTETSMLKFLVLLSLFVLSMLFLIFSPSLLFLLLGWDGLGVTSYLLVVYYMNYSSSVAGMVTFLVNRFGDVFFFLSLSCFYFVLDWSFYEHKYSYSILGCILVLTFITKSAQIPFSSWLPAAMAAPTPVSSLVHSSTLVTAGVYLLVRFSSMMGGLLIWLSIISIFTIMMAGVMANLDYDLKKVVAFSTLSQLGFMVSSYSCGLIIFCFFHLITHALFKASLFMCSGVVIHSLDNSQDFRNSSSFSAVAPFLTLCSMVCLLCLCGFPFSSGFFSKDLVLDGSLFSFFFFFFFFFGVVLTFSYSIRFAIYLYGVRLMLRVKVFSLFDSCYYLVYPIWILVMFALMFGGALSEVVPTLCGLTLVGAGWKLFYWSFLVIFVFLVSGFVRGYLFYVRKYFHSHMWFLVSLFSSRSIVGVLNQSKGLIEGFDHGWFEKFGPSGILNTLYFTTYLLVAQYSFFLLSIFLFFFWVL